MLNGGHKATATSFSRGDDEQSTCARETRQRAGLTSVRGSAKNIRAREVAASCASLRKARLVREEEISWGKC